MRSWCTRRRGKAAIFVSIQEIVCSEQTTAGDVKNYFLWAKILEENMTAVPTISPFLLILQPRRRHVSSYLPFSAFCVLILTSSQAQSRTVWGALSDNAAAFPVSQSSIMIQSTT